MKLLIIFEGLSPWLFLAWSPFMSASYVERQLAIPLGAKYEVHGWLETSLPCRPNSVAAGHSFGGKAALLYSERCKVPAVIMDDRTPPLGSCSGRAIEKVTAFYREGWMRGCAIKGAQNIKLSNSVSHVAVPAQPEVHKTVREMLK